MPALTPFGQQISVKYTLTGPDGTVATFNEPADANYVGYLTEVTGLDSPEVRDGGEALGGIDGGVNGDFFFGRRPITLAGEMVNPATEKDRNEKITKLTQACNALREDAVLSWTPAGGEAVSVKVRRQQPLRITGGWTKNFQVLLVSADARILSVAQEVSAGIKLGSTPSLVNKGSTLAYPILKLKGKPENAVIKNTTTGEEIALGYAPLAPNEGFGSANTYGSNLVSDANYLYANTGNEISRFNILTGVRDTKLTYVGSPFPSRVAVDATNLWVGTQAKSIWKFNKTTGVGAQVVEGLSGMSALAVDSGHLYYASGNAIGRCTLAGGAVENSWLTVEAGVTVEALAVDAGHIYWATDKSKIGRATIAGATIENNFIKLTTTPAFVYMKDLSVTATNIYWTALQIKESEGWKKTIGRATIAGGTIEENYIPEMTGFAHGISAQENALFWLTESTIGRKQFTAPTITVEIDTLNRTAKVAGASFYSGLIFQRTNWFGLTPGTNKIIIEGIAGEELALEVLWRNAWI